jgi:hypothetical protein
MKRTGIVVAAAIALRADTGDPPPIASPPSEMAFSRRMRVMKSSRPRSVSGHGVVDRLRSNAQVDADSRLISSRKVGPAIC